MTDPQGTPLIGVNIIEQGTSNGTVTDFDGNFDLEVAGPNAVLEFSYTGYQTQQVSIDNRTSLAVTLQEGVSLQEVVVTSLGITREKKSLTYSAQNVSTEELSQARELNVVNSLSGKVAGLSITRSGAGVGAASRVILRGNRSIAGDSQPLYVVDGVPILGDITDINPDDIASVSVLKGPNAAALYGNRASNGAIIITTKQGSTQGFNVGLSSTFMADIPNVLTKYQNEYGQGNNGQYSPNSEQSWGSQLNGSSVDHWSPDPNWSEPTYPYSAQPDNVEDFFQTGYNWANTLSINGGNERVQTYFSYTFTKAEGTVPNNALQRHNAHLRVTNRIGSRLQLDGKLNYIRESIDNQLAQGENFTNPVRHALRLPRNIRTSDVEMFEYTDAAGRNRQHFWNPGSNGGANPYWAANRNLRNNTIDRVIGFVSLKYQFTDYLSLQARTALDRLVANSEETLYSDTYIVADNGRFSVGSSEASEWNSDLLLSFSKNLSSDWFVSANAGGNIRIERNTGLSSNTGVALTLPNFFALANTQQVLSSYNVGAPRDVHSVYAFAQVAWKDAVFLDVTARNDWSSTLPPDNWSFFYPSVGLNVVLTDLISAPSWLTFAKFRGSWAEVGNDTQPFQTKRTANFSAGGNNGFLTLSNTIPNEDLLPEETVSTELGFDVRFFRNRLGLDFTWYKSNTRNQLFSIALPAGSGASNLFTNGGDVQNTGIEAILNITPIETDNFSWDISLNYTQNRSEVVKINDERPSIVVAQDFLRSFRIEQGEQWGEVYSRGFVRNDAGQVLIGADGLPQTTTGFTVRVANYNPDWLGGIRNVFNYGNLNFSFLIDIRQGGSYTSLTNAILYGDGTTEATLDGRDGTAVFGQDIFASEEAVLASDGSPNNLPMDIEAMWRKLGGRNAPIGEAFAYDASNIRLRELVVGYRFPFTNSPVIDGLRVSLVGRNLFFLSPPEGDLDPEVIVGTAAAAAGFESFGPPTARSIGLSVNVDF